MVYFLCNSGTIYYIGETFRPIQRIKIHYKEKEYFDTVFYKETRLDCLNLVEKVLINEIEPIMNNRRFHHVTNPRRSLRFKMRQVLFHS